jgi:hypothetical protein
MTDFDFVSWLRWVTIGSTLGVAVAGSIPVWLYLQAGRPESVFSILVFWSAVAAGGAVNGLSLGYFQQRVLRAALPQFPGFEWTLATAAASAAGWLIVVLPFIFLANPEPNEANPLLVRKNTSVDFFLLTAAGAGLFFGAVIGFAQWLTLRRGGRQSVFWIPANAAGWALGMGGVYLAATMGDKYTPQFIKIVLCSLGGEICGNLVSLITFPALRYLKIR